MLGSFLSKQVSSIPACRLYSPAFSEGSLVTNFSVNRAYRVTFCLIPGLSLFRSSHLLNTRPLSATVSNPPLSKLRLTSSLLTSATFLATLRNVCGFRIQLYKFDLVFYSRFKLILHIRFYGAGVGFTTPLPIFFLDD